MELAVHYRTAHRAGGDYYDFFPLPGGKFGVLIADVSGHGTQAAVLLAITHSLAHAYPEPPTGPGKLLAHLNAHLSRRYTRSTGSFVTAFYAVFDPAENTFTYATAGHLPPRMCLAGEPTWKAVPSPNRLPLGVNPRDAAYPEQVVRFAPGDRVALYTDGILDAVDPANEPFGYDRLDAALSWAPQEADAVVREVIACLDRFAAGAPLADDRTLLVVRRTDPVPPRPTNYVV
jgi:sigma-B regulation protein RsbU (phosphoserine phosphatase)